MAGRTKEQMAEIRTYRIYKHTINGVSYIGMSSELKNYKRFQYGAGYEYNSEFHKAIYEEGWKSVTTIILETIVGTFYEAHEREIYWIQDAVKKGEKLFNKDHIKLPEEPKYNIKGVTVNGTLYFETMKAAAEYIGVTKAAISCALKENRDCKGFNLEYGNTLKEEN